jgi:t-SNARE complex subunit (syntaxin)
VEKQFNPSNAELDLIYHLLALLGAHPILHVSRKRVNKSRPTIDYTIIRTNAINHRRASSEGTVAKFKVCVKQSKVYEILIPHKKVESFLIVIIIIIIIIMFLFFLLL